MELNHLKHFYFVVKYGGFTRAAEQLRVQQPVVSRTIKLLESNLGYRLVERNGRKVIPTAMGNEVYKRCCLIFDEVEELGRLVRDEKLRGVLSIGATEPIASYLMPSLLKDLITQNPDLRPALYSAPALTLLEMIAAGQMEFGFFFHVPESNFDLVIERIKAIQFHYVIGKSGFKDMQARARFIGSREIDNFRVKRLPPVAQLLEKTEKLTRVVSTNNFTTQKALALSGVGVALLPDFMVKKELKGGQLKSIFPNKKFEFALKVVTRQSAYLSKGAKRVLGSMQTTLESIA